MKNLLAFLLVAASTVSATQQPPKRDPQIASLVAQSEHRSVLVKDISTKHGFDTLYKDQDSVSLGEFTPSNCVDNILVLGKFTGPGADSSFIVAVMEEIRNGDVLSRKRIDTIIDNVNLAIPLPVGCCACGPKYRIKLIRMVHPYYQYDWSNAKVVRGPIVINQAYIYSRVKQ